MCMGVIPALAGGSGAAGLGGLVGTAFAAQQRNATKKSKSDGLGGTAMAATSAAADREARARQAARIGGGAKPAAGVGALAPLGA